MPRISIGDLELHVLDAGTGPPLLLVHGFPLDHTMWREQIHEFARTHHVIAPDLRGFGQSDVTPGTVSMRQYADDLARLLDALRVSEPVCFCGLSMGGYIAWQFFQHHRSRLAALILCDTRALADDQAARENRHAMADRVLAEGPEFIAQTMPARLFSERTRATNVRLVRDVEEMIRRAPAEGIAAAARGMAQRPDMTGLLETIDVPVLVVVGEEDAISTADEMRSIAAAIPGARLLVVPKAGHMAPLEEPAIVNEAIEAFLARS